MDMGLAWDLDIVKLLGFDVIIGDESLPLKTMWYFNENGFRDILIHLDL
jgi:hypothetical protein